MSSEALSNRWRYTCLPVVALTTLLAGCSMPGKKDGLTPVTTASYQEHVIIEDPPKKIDDPLSLKLRYAKWMEEIENFEEAQANYNVVLQEQPENVEAILGLARINQVVGRNDAAEAGFKKALSLQPTSPVAKDALGQYYVDRGQLTDALPLLGDAVQSDPANKVYRFHLAVALARSGDTTAALPQFIKAVDEPVAYYNVAMILKSQRRYAQAEQHLQQALTRKPDFEAAHQALMQVRQQVQAAGIYAAQPRRPAQIQQAGHSRPGTPSTLRRQQYSGRR